MSMISDVSLAVIASIYVLLAIGVFIGLFILTKLYGDLKHKMDDMKRDMEPYKVKVDDISYKVQKITNASSEIVEDAKSIADKTKETTLDLMNKTKETTDEVSSLIIGTKNKTKSHIDYVFQRVESIEEKLDNIYIFLNGVTMFTSKFPKKKEEEKDV